MCDDAREEGAEAGGWVGWWSRKGRDRVCRLRSREWVVPNSSSQ